MKTIFLIGLIFINSAYADTIEEYSHDQIEENKDNKEDIIKLNWLPSYQNPGVPGGYRPNIPGGGGSYGGVTPPAKLKQFGESCQFIYECGLGLTCSKDNLCSCFEGFEWSPVLNNCFKCPAGWFPYKSRCYLHVQTPLTWNEAYAYCAKRSSILIEFNKGLFVDTLQTFFKDNRFLPGPYLIGLRTYNIPGNWTWSDGCSLPTCGPWWSGCQASNQGGNNKEIGLGCAQTDRKFIQSIDCDKTTQKFLCEIAHPKVPKSSNSPATHSTGSVSKQIPTKQCHYDYQCVVPLLCNTTLGLCQCPQNQQWSTITGTCKTCPSGWKMHEDSCLYISSDKLTWSDADSNCGSNNSKLLVVGEPFINTLSSIFAANDLQSDYWIGAKVVNGMWALTNGTQINDGYWWGRCGSPGPQPEPYKCVKTFGIAIESDDCSSLNKYICILN